MDRKNFAKRYCFRSDMLSGRKIPAVKCASHFTARLCESVWACRVEASCEAWSVANFYLFFVCGNKIDLKQN